jgi:hypothetical protein
VPFKLTIVYADDHFVEIWVDGPGQASGVVHDTLLASRAGGPSATVAKHIEIDPFAKPMKPSKLDEPRVSPPLSLSKRLKDQVS